MRLVSAVAILLAASTALAGAAIASDAAVSPFATSEDAAAPHDQGSNVSMGVAVSSFVHAQQGAAESEVEQGMWNASFERNPSTDAVQQRSTSMQRQLDRLQERRQALQQAYENGEIPAGKYHAKMSKVKARLAALQRAANETAPIAKRVGANPQRFREIGKQAASAKAKIPAGVGPGGTPPGHGGAPPGQQGESGNQSDGPPGQNKGSAGQAADPGNQGGVGGGPPSIAGPPGHQGPPGQGTDEATETPTETESGQGGA